MPFTYVLKFISTHLKPYRYVAIIYGMMAFLAGFFGPINSFLAKKIVNCAAGSTFESMGMFACGLVLNFFICDNVTWRSIKLIECYFAPKIKNNIIDETLKKLMKLSLQFFYDHLSGSISNRVLQLTEAIEHLLFRSSQDLIRGSVLVVLALTSMCFVHPVFSLILFTWVIVFCAFSIYTSFHIIKRSDIHAKTQSMFSGNVVDIVANMTTIRLFGGDSYEIKRLDQSKNPMSVAFKKKTFLILMTHFVQGTLIAMMLGAMLFGLVSLYKAQHLSLGDFALIIGLSMEVAHCIWYTMGILEDFFDNIGKAKESLSLLCKSTLPIADAKNAARFEASHASIRFENVCFGYENKDLLFKDLSIHIKASQKVGIVGHSGSGKSSFINLILRSYETTSGDIFINDRPIKDIARADLCNMISVIAQDPVLFHRSLFENIRYGRLDASHDDVVAAAKRAHAHEFIQKVPNGYETLVGERGIKLSGGERQRISIARAILKNSPILILDEATSSLDLETERYIQESLFDVMQYRTTLVIAHRISTLTYMERILVFDNGRIVEDDSHHALLQKDGTYARLYARQFEGFLPLN